MKAKPASVMAPEEGDNLLRGNRASALRVEAATPVIRAKGLLEAAGINKHPAIGDHLESEIA